MKNIGRILAFSIALIAVFGAIGGVVWFLTRPAPTNGGDVAVELGGLPSPNKFLIGLYLDSKRDALAVPPGTDDTPVTFVIQPGETAAEIAARLEEEGLISDAELFRRYAQYEGLDAGIEAGEFTLRRTMTIPDVAQALQEGQRPEQVVTIPEGLRLEQVADQVAAQTSIEREAFLNLVTTGWRDLGLGFGFLAEIPPEATLEGFLFPDTYRLPEDAGALDLLTRMLENFDARVTPEVLAAAQAQGLTTYQLVTLASVVEREAVLDEERPLIAGVFHNRLEAGWYLESCPTVQYGLATPGDWWPSLTLADLDQALAYSTYANPGLPPGPICNPGLASIRAAANPADTEYFFFLADCNANDGSHLFAVTNEEHVSNYETCGAGLP